MLNINEMSRRHGAGRTRRCTSRGFKLKDVSYQTYLLLYDVRVPSGKSCYVCIT